ncbi:MAG: DUF4097 family beta strand repeat-containing protein [Bacteroidota bacterium]
MKFYHLLIPFLSVSTLALYAQKHTETISRKLTFTNESSNYVLFVENINGAVEISPYSGNEILLEANLEIIGEDATALAQGKKELEVISRAKKDSILIFISCPAISYYRYDSRRNYNFDSRKIDYDFKVDMHLKVPENVLSDVSTINNGDIVINNYKGAIKAANVNGNVLLTDVGEVVKATTVNGDIEVITSNNPSANANFNTINGDIKVHYPNNLGAKIGFKSFNGKFYTDFKVVERLPVKVIKTKSHENENIYKLEGYTTIKIGEGGPEIRFETFNGDVYVSSK